MKKTKEIRQKTEAYILDCIDPDGYGVVCRTDKEKLNFLYSTFKKEYGDQLRYYGNNEQTAFVNWLQGLPSCFNIDFTNYRILELLREWGVIPEGMETRKEEKYLSYWWNKIYMVFHAMLRRANTPQKEKKERLTKDEFQVQGYYGKAWEIVTTEEIRTEAKQRLAEYRENEPGTNFRIKTVRSYKNLRDELKRKLHLTDDHFGSHESDLYVRALPKVREYLKENYSFWSNVTMFKSNIDGETWLDIPFALLDEKIKAKGYGSN